MGYTFYTHGFRTDAELRAIGLTSHIDECYFNTHYTLQLTGHPLTRRLNDLYAVFMKWCNEHGQLKPMLAGGSLIGWWWWQQPFPNDDDMDMCNT